MTETANNHMELYEKVRVVPKEALKEIKGGRLKGMSDINPMWRIKLLTELYGICGIGWKIEIVDRRLEKGSADQIACFVDINLFIKVDGQWSDAIPGMGGSAFVTKESSGLYTSDECFKMAYTDAISVACKSLGFAADVYFANDRTKYTTQGEEDKSPSAPNGSTSTTTSNSPVNVAPFITPVIKAKYQAVHKGSLEGLENYIEGLVVLGLTVAEIDSQLTEDLNKLKKGA